MTSTETFVADTNVATMPPSQTIYPPQPLPFIPMVPPLANTFSSPMTPTSVTSTLVDNLINNNPTPTTLSYVTPTSVTTSADNVVSNVRTLDKEANVELTAVDSLATSRANQYFSSPNASNELIRNEQTVGVQSPSSKASFQQTVGAPASISQQFMQPEGLLDSWIEDK